MIYLLAFCRVATGLIFTISSVGKAWNISKFRQSIIGFGFFDKRLSSVVAIFVLCGEIAVILLVVIGGPLLLLGFLLSKWFAPHLLRGVSGCSSPRIARHLQLFWPERETRFFRRYSAKPGLY